MTKEYELVKFGYITYTNKKIISKNSLGFVKNAILYDEIESFYVKTIPAFVNYSRIGFERFIIIITKDRKKHYLSLGDIGWLESKHISFIKKMAPQAKFIKKEKLTKKVKRKLKQIDAYLKSDD